MSTSGNEHLLSIQSEHRLRSENLAFDVDVWYPLLSGKFQSDGVTPITFKTRFVPLRRKEAESMVAYQKERFLSKKHSLTIDHVEILNQLEQRIQETLNEIGIEKGAFLRLCGRSPKDGEPLDREKLRETFRQAYENIKKEELENRVKTNKPHSITDLENDPLVKLRAISNVSWLRVHNAESAMSLLLTSERVYADLYDWLRWGEPEQIVFREFEEDLSLQYEFRCFVHKNRLNAITQYDHYCSYPNLANLKEKIERDIFRLWHTVHPMVGTDSYIIDFAFLPNKDKMMVIELSPFLTCTGTALFSWKDDRQQLENGPFEFRIRTDSNLTDFQHNQLCSLIETNWDARWRAEIPHYKEFYSHAKEFARELHIDLYAAGGVAAVSSIMYFSDLYKTVALTLLGSSALWLASRGTLIVLNNQKNKKKHTCLLFFYGTLKRNFHWNHKYLWNAQFISETETLDSFPLVVGKSGVPYLLGDMRGQGHKITGELWLVDQETLQGLDEYEGIGKGYYERMTIDVKSGKQGQPNLQIKKADIYVLIKSSEELRKEKMLSEYTMEIHQSKYKPIEHILAKQERYLDVSHDRT